MSREMALDIKDARRKLGALIRARIVPEYGTLKNCAYQVGIDDVSILERVSQGTKKINVELATVFSKVFGGSVADWINAENKILAGERADVPIYEIPQQKQQEGDEVSAGETSNKLNAAAGEHTKVRQDRSLRIYYQKAAGGIGSLPYPYEPTGDVAADMETMAKVVEELEKLGYDIV